MTAAPSYVDRLRRPQPCDHLVQLYTDEAFLTRVVGDFLREGLANEEGAAVIATPQHVALFVERLNAAGLDAAAAVSRGQLVVLDARGCLDTFMVDGMPDPGRFFALTLPVLERLRRAGHDRVRCYGEMVDLLWAHSMPATVALEQLWNDVLSRTGVSLLCAYGIDNFDLHAHRGVLHKLSACHSELIPVEDYDRLEQAVTRAYEEVFGRPGDARALREHVASLSGDATKMPPSQAALLGLDNVGMQLADAVIARAREYYRRP